EPWTPKRVFRPPPVFCPSTPGDPAAADEFVPVTAGVVVALVNVPVAASAAVGINTITAAIAPNFQNLVHPWFMRLTSDRQGGRTWNRREVPTSRPETR